MILFELNHTPYYFTNSYYPINLYNFSAHFLENRFALHCFEIKQKTYWLINFEIYLLQASYVKQQKPKSYLV